jgi:hypothetical protein
MCWSVFYNILFDTLYKHYVLICVGDLIALFIIYARDLQCDVLAAM